MTKNQINYLLVLATLLVLGFYVNSGIDVFMKLKLSRAMRTHSGVFEGGPRFAGQPSPQFHFSGGVQPPPGMNAIPQEAMRQAPPLPPEIQKFLEARTKASKTQAPAAPASDKR